MKPPLPPRGFVPTPFSWHQEIELDITTLTNMGQGIGRVDGWVVMVRFALPGERIRARVFRNDKNFSEADVVEVMTPSPDRVDPRCPLYGTCGGCQYQNFAYPAQLEWKRRQVEELLRHMAKVEFPVAPVHGSPQEYGYRSKITPHFEPQRDGSVPPIGFLRAGRRHGVVDVEQCPIATDAINAVLPEVRAEVQARTGTYRRGATLLLRDANGRVCRNPKETMVERVGALEFEFLAGDFFQNNPFILEEFVQYAIRQARDGGAKYLVDAYCGSGLFALSGAGEFECVAGIEIVQSAVAQAQGNAKRNGITNCEFIAGSAEAIFAGVGFPPDETAVLIDPPRKGTDEVFLQQLFAWGPRTVVYVSCNPATQMRDLRFFLDAGWKLSAVQPFDLFPQTKHLECVMTLTRP